MLSPLFRLVTTPALALFAWTLAEGARVFATGRFSGRAIARDDVENHPHALLLSDASAIDYGLFGSFLVEKGIDPHALAPFFVIVGALGLVGVVLLLMRRQTGYALVVTAALGAAVRIGVPSLVGLALVVVLLVPRVRRAFFRAVADREALARTSRG